MSTEVMNENVTEVKRRSQMQEIVRRFKKNKLAMAGLIFLLLLVIISFATTIIDIVTDNYIYDNYVIKQDLRNRLQTPSLSHPFGTDEFGRDILLRVVWGARYSIFIGVVSMIFATIIGGILGAISGFYGKICDNIIMRLMDVFLAIPQMLLATAIVAALGASTFNLLLAIAISTVPTMARTVRAQVLTIKEQEFIEAARAVGASDARIIAKYIVPNSLSPIIVQATLGVASGILSIAGLSFVGLGINPPTPEWGSMLSNARTYMRDSWNVTIIPGAFNMLTILALNLMGGGIRDALDPRMKD